MSSSPSLSMNGRHWVMLLILSLLWGSAFPLAHFIILSVPPLTLVFYRVILAAMVLGLMVLYRCLHIPRNRVFWWRVGILGVLNNILPFSLIYAAQTQIPGGLAAILNAMTPLFSALLAHHLTRDERLTPSRLVGVLCGFLGVTIMIGIDAVSGTLLLLPQLACLGAALSYALAGIWGRKLKDTPPPVIAFGQCLVSTIFMGILITFLAPPWQAPIPSFPTLAAILVLAIFGTAAAYLLYFRLLGAVGATNTVLVTLLIPVVAIWIGALALDEPLSPQNFAGMAMIGLGLSIIDGRLWRQIWTYRTKQAISSVCADHRN